MSCIRVEISGTNLHITLKCAEHGKFKAIPPNTPDYLLYSTRVSAIMLALMHQPPKLDRHVTAGQEHLVSWMLEYIYKLRLCKGDAGEIFEPVPGLSHAYRRMKTEKGKWVTILQYEFNLNPFTNNLDL
jgi:hypothetical protein